MSNFDDPFDTDLAIAPHHDPRNVPAVQSGKPELVIASGAEDSTQTSWRGLSRPSTSS